MDRMQNYTLIGYLRDISDKLGHIYIDMVDHYPKILSMMEEKFPSLQSREISGVDSLGLDEMETSVKSLKNMVDVEGSILSDISRKDSNFLDKLEEELNKSRVFEQYIEQIEDDSMELELISLNAMVAALKAGKNGGAFPYITEQLQSVSRQSAVLSGELKNHGTRMDQVFREYLEIIQQERNDLKNSLETMENCLQDILELHLSYRNQVLEFVKDIQKGINLIKGPLYNIIQEVQKHDIVRQSIDHVILSLEKGGAEAHTIEETLDLLSFQIQVYSFCTDILNEILWDIQGTYQLFNDKISDLSRLIEGIRKTGQDFLQQNSNDFYAAKIQDLQVSFLESSHLLTKNSSGHSFKNGDTILKEILKLEESSNGFIRIINWIKTINISSRVEAAKLPNLDNMNIIIENINTRTDSIEINVERITKIIRNFKKSSEILFNEYSKFSNSNLNALDSFLIKLKIGLAQINDAHEGVNQGTHEVMQVSKVFDEFYTRTKDDLIMMEALIQELKQVIDLVGNRKVSYEEDLKRALVESPYDEWTLQEDKIKELIDQFTIFLHKKKADINNSMTIDDEGAASGEITLF